MTDQTDLVTLGPQPSPIGLLVVDDDEGIRTMLDTGLRREGFAVRLAACGLDAVAAFRRHRGSIHVVLMDVRMPDLDGPQTFAALRSVDPAIRCCFMTGNLGRYTESGLIAMGAETVIAKPFRVPDVAARIQRIVGSQSAPIVGPESSP